MFRSANDKVPGSGHSCGHFYHHLKHSSHITSSVHYHQPQPSSTTTESPRTTIEAGASILIHSKWPLPHSFHHTSMTILISKRYVLTLQLAWTFPPHQSGDQLSLVLSDIFNTSLERRHVLVCFKTSAIIPIHKNPITGLNGPCSNEIVEAPWHDMVQLHQHSPPLQSPSTFRAPSFPTKYELNIRKVQQRRYIYI